MVLHFGAALGSGTNRLRLRHTRWAVRLLLNGGMGHWVDKHILWKASDGGGSGSSWGGDIQIILYFGLR